MNMEEDSLNHIHLTQEQLLGNCIWQGNLDMFHIVFIGVAKKLANKHKDYELHRLLGVLFSNELSADRKLDIIANEYDIPVEEKIREEVVEMCNLGQGVYEKGQAQGIILGETQMIIGMHENGLSIEKIAQIAKKTTEEIRSIITREETTWK